MQIEHSKITCVKGELYCSPYTWRERARRWWRRLTAYTCFDRAWTPAARAEAAICLAWMAQQGIVYAPAHLQTGLRLYCQARRAGQGAGEE